ncbi:MAG: hypothetical protein M1276_02255, partial [Deltaproteobacteria bacterium]|nr:hypothetical protein [Deltaproteobacteria bacterium]
MTEKEKIRLKNALIVCAESYNRALSDGVIELYFTCLKHYPIEKVLSALMSCIKEISFMPTVHDIIARIESCPADGQNDPEARAEQAWSYVLKAIEYCGAYKSFTFKDVVIRKVIDTWDFKVLCNTDREKIHWKKREFTDSYKNFLKLKTELNAPL